MPLRAVCLEGLPPIATDTVQLQMLALTLHRHYVYDAPYVRACMVKHDPFW